MPTTIMDTLRDLGITTIENLIALIRNIQYYLLLPLTPILEKLIAKILQGQDIEINGNRPWDIQVQNRKFYARLATYGPLGLGESFMDKWVDCKDLEGFSFRLAKHGGYRRWCRLPWVRLIYYLRWNCFNLQTKERSSNSCDPHYNLGVEFFEAFCDESVTYSVAYWETATTLAQAQKDKMEIVAQKLKLKPGMRVLDMGCGFGSLGKYLAENYGVEVVGVTNSTKMAEEASRRCGDCVDIQVADWRDVEGKFDRVVCIEMVFHVGRHNLKQFFMHVNKWLKEDGLFVMQDFASEHGYLSGEEFIHKYFFPGVYIGPFEEILEYSRGELAFLRFQDMTLDTVKTDRALFEHFEQNWPRLSKIYDKKMFEAMRFYFNIGAGFSGARAFFTYQAVLGKIPTKQSL